MIQASIAKELSSFEIFYGGPDSLSPLYIIHVLSAAVAIGQVILWVKCFITDSESHRKRPVQISTETDHGDDDFDLGNLEIDSISAHLVEHLDDGNGMYKANHLHEVSGRDLVIVLP